MDESQAFKVDTPEDSQRVRTKAGSGLERQMMNSNLDTLHLSFLWNIHVETFSRQLITHMDLEFKRKI